jgi:hypothetical protein
MIFHTANTYTLSITIDHIIPYPPYPLMVVCMIWQSLWNHRL